MQKKSYMILKFVTDKKQCSRLFLKVVHAKFGEFYRNINFEMISVSKK